MSSNEHYLRSPRGNVMGRDEHDVLDVPRLTLLATVPQSFGAAAATSVTFDYAPVDSDGMYNPSSPLLATCKTSGFYLATAHMTWTASVLGAFRGLWFAVNNSGATRFSPDYKIPAATVPCTCSCVAYFTLSAGDTLGVVAYQDSAGAISSTTDGATTTPAEFSLCLASTI